MNSPSTGWVLRCSSGLHAGAAAADYGGKQRKLRTGLGSMRRPDNTDLRDLWVPAFGVAPAATGVMPPACSSHDFFLVNYRFAANSIAMVAVHFK